MQVPFRWLPVQYFGQIRFLFVASDADYLTLDARYERVREAGVIAHQAVLIAIGINWASGRSWPLRWPTARAKAAGRNSSCA